MHISTLDTRSMSGLKFGSKFGKSRMSWCLDTNHFIGTPPFFIIILWIFTLWEGGDFFWASLSEPVFSLLFSNLFVSPLTDNLLFLKKWKREKSKNECVACKCQSWVCLQMKGTCF